MDGWLKPMGDALGKRGRLLWLTAAAVLLFLCLVFLLWTLRLAGQPRRQVTPYVPLDEAGLEGVEVSLDYPRRLGPREGPQPIAIMARSRDAGSASPFELSLVLSDEALAFLDAGGQRITGRVTLRPGYPQPQVHTLFVQHADTQVQGGLLRTARVQVQPMVCGAEGCLPLADLAFRIALDGRHNELLRGLAVSIGRVLPLVLIAIGILGTLLLLGYYALQARRRDRDRRLAQNYRKLRQQMVRGDWPSAQISLEKIRAIEAHYRDVDRLAEQIYSSQSTGREREALYREGLRAYNAKRWAEAATLLTELEQQAPYYRKVGYLARTAALYVDLQSRDCSRRVAAAKALGQVADLVEMRPLLDALGDKRSEVAEAAEAAFRRIGLDAFESLLQGLIHDSEKVRERAYQLLQSYGQRARGRLEAALRHDDPCITRDAARLLAKLGARQELAESLLWIGARHQAGIVAALLSEGVAAADALLASLCQAPRERQELLLRAIAALKARVDVDRRITEALRSTDAEAQRELLQQAQQMAPRPFGAVGGAERAREADRGSVQRLRRLEHRRS